MPVPVPIPFRSHLGATTPVPPDDDDVSSPGEAAYDLAATEASPAPSPGIEAEQAAPRAPVGVPEVRAGRSPAPEAPESWWPPDVLFPLKAAEGVGMVASLGLASWFLATLIPEYCLALVSDGEKLGARPMGQLIALVTATPALILAPPTLAYWLQYLARVLVAGADGEALPPRPPDRNFEGIFAGMGSWLAFGLGAGLLPSAAYLVASSWGGPWGPALAVIAGLAGLPFALMGLMTAFLRNDASPIRPGSVVEPVARLGRSYLGLCLATAASLGLGIGAFAAAFALRSGHFAAFLVAALAAWLLTAWASIVVMHTIGAYYHAHEDRLRWRRPRPRW